MVEALNIDIRILLMPFVGDRLPGGLSFGRRFGQIAYRFEFFSVHQAHLVFHKYRHRPFVGAVWEML